MLSIPIVRPQDELLSIPESARLLGVTAMTARIWALTGKVPARPADNGRLLLRRADVEALVQARQVTAPTDESERHHGV